MRFKSQFMKVTWYEIYFQQKKSQSLTQIELILVPKSPISNIKLKIDTNRSRLMKFYHKMLLPSKEMVNWLGILKVETINIFNHLFYHLFYSSLKLEQVHKARLMIIKQDYGIISYQVAHLHGSKKIDNAQLLVSCRQM